MAFQTQINHPRLFYSQFPSNYFYYFKVHERRKIEILKILHKISFRFESKIICFLHHMQQMTCNLVIVWTLINWKSKS
jgi:hypothetical protein